MMDSSSFLAVVDDVKRNYLSEWAGSMADNFIELACHKLFDWLKNHPYLVNYKYLGVSIRYIDFENCFIDSDTIIADDEIDEDYIELREYEDENSLGIVIKDFEPIISVLEERGFKLYVYEPEEKIYCMFEVK